MPNSMSATRPDIKTRTDSKTRPDSETRTVAGRLVFEPKIRHDNISNEAMCPDLTGTIWCCLIVKPDDDGVNGGDRFDLLLLNRELMRKALRLHAGDLIGAKVDVSRTRTRSFTGRSGEALIWQYVARTLIRKRDQSVPGTGTKAKVA